MVSGNTGNVEVAINLLDVNDNEPIFVSQPYYAVVPITAQKGHVILQVMSALININIYKYICTYCAINTLKMCCVFKLI